MANFGLIAYGSYLPFQAISRQSIFDQIGWIQGGLKAYAKGKRSYADWDEDAVTLAVAAARQLLKTADNTQVQQLSFASTTAPFLDRSNAGIVAAALDLADHTHCYDSSGSQRAALAPLVTACHNQSDGLLIAAGEKKPVQPANVMEMLAGDAGSAILTGSKNVIAELVATQSVRSDFVDHYRTAESGTDYVLEERWVREEGLAKIVSPLIATLLEENNLSVEDIDHFILPVAYPSHARAIARTCGIQEDAVADALFTDCGFSGVAHPLLMLSDCLDRATPDSLILLTGFGQGMDAILLRTTEKITSYQASITVQNFMTNLRIEDNYPRFLASNGQFHPDWGMRAERDNRTAQTVAFDKSRDIYGLVGGICTSCGTPQFPKARRCVNPECNALDAQQDYRFADIPATVKSFTEDWMAFNRNPPLIYGNISFEGGGNMFIEMTGFAPGDIAIGDKVEMDFRIKDIDDKRGFHRYFWKAAAQRKV